MPRNLRVENPGATSHVMSRGNRRRISGNSLAEKAGPSQSLISSLETNPWNPTIDTLLRIAGVLKVDLGEILTTAQKHVETTTKR